MSSTYWIARKCIHWDAARNKRFRIVRLDDESCDPAGALWDGDELEWRPFIRLSNRGSWTMLREATEKEINETVRIL